MIALLRRISRIFAWGAGGLLLLCAALIGIDVVLRNTLRLVPMHSFELSRYAFGAALAFGFAYALVERAHIRIDILHRVTPRGVHPALDVLALVALVPVTAALAWYAWDVAGQSFRLGAVSNTPLAMPLVIPQGLWAAGLTWFAVVALLMSMSATYAFLRGRPAQVETIGGMPGLFGDGVEAVSANRQETRA